MGKNTSVVIGEAQEAFIRAQIKKGRYASVSEAVRSALDALAERDEAVERWLREEVAPAYDAFLADPDSAVPLDEAFAGLSGGKTRAA